MQVQAVLQAQRQRQRQKLFLAQLTSDTPLHLIAELGSTLAHQRAIVLVVAKRARRPHRRGATTMHAGQTKKQWQKRLKKQIRCPEKLTPRNNTNFRDFTFAFQLIVDVRDQSIFAHEVLVRGINVRGRCQCWRK